MNQVPIRPQTPQSVPVLPGKFGKEELRRVKVHIFLSQQTDQTLVVTLSLPLDPNYPSEASAIEHFGLGQGNDGYLSIQYSLSMNFEVGRHELDTEVSNIYGDEENEILGKEELEIVGKRQLRKLLAPLATLGANTFYRLFLDEEIKLLRPNETHRAIVRGAVSSIFSRSQIISIETQVSPGQKSTPLFPWAFLYDDRNFDSSNQSTLDPMRFWGFRHVIQEELECTATIKKLPPMPSILTAVCSHADNAQWHKRSEHALVKHNGSITEAPTVNELGKALAACDADCFYFFGHAYQPNPPIQTKSCLMLRGQSLTVDDLNRRYQAPHFNKNPVLAFLNGCRTSPLHVWDKESIAGFICEKEDQKVCCVSTVASVPASVAAMFGCHFWKLFLNRKLPVGDAVLKTRRVLLRKWNNPLGLLYTVFGSVDTRVGS